ncbi:MAG: hypothetical protein EBR28_07220 [Planctomycetia bacterium]|nr:hypothetical protein [Planctomycetia bacterium]
MRCLADEVTGLSLGGLRSGVRAWAMPLVLIVASSLASSAGISRADEFIVLAEADAAPPLALPTVTANLDSFDAVAGALERERQRVAALEARLAALEKNAVEPLPAPGPTEPSAGARTGVAKGGPAAPSKDGKTDAKKDDKKPADEEYEVGTDLTMPTKWNFGFEGNSPHKDFRVKVGGRVQFDNVAFSQGEGPAQKPANGGLTPLLTDSTNFRRARFRIDGRMYELYDFAAEFDFVNQLNSFNLVSPTEAGLGNYPAVTELWLQLRELPILGTVRVGNQKDPFGFEHMTSSRYLNFMERSYAQDLYEGPFNNGFIPGLRTINWTEDQRLNWSYGIFKQNANPFGYANTGRANSLVGRLVWLPVYEDEGKKLLHLGVAGRAQQTNRDDLVRLRARGDLRNGPPGPLNSIYIDSGLLKATWQNQLGLEFVGNNGPWSFQSEYFGNWLFNTTSNTGAFNPGTPFGSTNNSGLGPTVVYVPNINYGTAGLQPKGAACGTYFTNSGYAEVLYFLTGESRAYDLFDCRFDRVTPRNNFYCLRDSSGRIISSSGALQVGARYQYANLSNHLINGGTLNALTVGLNWFFNPNAKLQFNYDFCYRDFTNNLNKNGSGWITGFGTRVAYDF